MMTTANCMARQRKVAALFFVTLAAVSAGWLAAQPAGPALALTGGAFRVENWDASGRPAAWQDILSVFVEGSPAPQSPITGSYIVESKRLVFRPRYPLTPGLSYRAVFKPANLERVFAIPRAGGPAAFVEQVYPTADRLPENQLKFYIQFSAPMSRREVYQRVRLQSGEGRAVEDAFLELGEELWDREGRRVTLLFDPGRIKRGLVPNQELGPALEADRRYSLLIDGGFPDEEGRPLRSGFRKDFLVEAADRTPPALATWTVTPPRAGSRDPLEVVFPEPLDWSLLQRMIEVVDPAGKGIPGGAAADRHETRWRFTPRDPWPAGVHRLRVDSALEDLAGNKIDRPFEVDVFEKVQKQLRRAVVELPFRIE